MITSNPDHIHQILSGSFDSFPKGAKFMERAKGLFGPRGVFVGDGVDWKFVGRRDNHGGYTLIVLILLAIISIP